MSEEQQTQIVLDIRKIYVLAELIPLLSGLWWVWLASNQQPPPYQDGALTN